MSADDYQPCATCGSTRPEACCFDGAVSRIVDAAITAERGRTIAAMRDVAAHLARRYHSTGVEEALTLVAKKLEDSK